MKKILTILVVYLVMPGQTQLEKVACSNEFNKERDEYIEKSMCAPRELFLNIAPSTSYEEIWPEAVWVKRCQGRCSSGSQCQQSESVTRQIPIRVTNLRTRKEICSTYPVVEHAACSCGSALSHQARTRSLASNRG